MSKNSKYTASDIHKIWEKAGKNLSETQQLNKEKMENLINKTSTEFSSGMKRLLKADAVFKAALMFGFILIAALNLANLFVLASVLVCIIIGAISLKQERLLIEGLDEIQEYKGNIRDCLAKSIKYYNANVFRYPVVLSMSVFLFYILGGLLYHWIQYKTIRPVEDLEDGIVLFAFLLFSVILSFVIYYPYFRSRVNYLKTLVEDIDSSDLIQDHVARQKIRKRWTVIITSILILTGIIALAALIIAYF
jgi:hypothetical protein